MYRYWVTYQYYKEAANYICELVNGCQMVVAKSKGEAKIKFLNERYVTDLYSMRILTIRCPDAIAETNNG